MTYDYTDYLAAKISVDDRALNRNVLAEVQARLPTSVPRVLEVGAGLGTMVARLLDWGVLTAGDYTLVDVDPRLLRDAGQWLRDWAVAQHRHCEPIADGLLIGELRVHFVVAELAEYLDTGGGQPADLLIAHAFLDLVDVPELLPALLRLIVPGGLYWFTINYDGESTLVPEHPLDEQILRAYHQDMDERVRYGRTAGESRTGRHLFGYLRAAEAPALAAGSSDWVVQAGPDGAYPGHEAYFLGRILQTIEVALADRVAPEALAQWITARQRQLADGELVYVAHQLDFAGRSAS